MPEESLDEIRRKIDRIDETIVKSLGERQRIVKKVLADKLSSATNVRDPEREEKLIEKLKSIAADEGVDPYFLEQMYREIIQYSVRYQTHALVDQQNEKAADRQIKVAYQGTDGAYSHQAAMRHFEPRYDSVVCIGYKRFAEAAEAVELGDADVAFLPIENTTAGSINDTYDLLAEKELYIIGEEVLQVNHCLMAPEQVEVSNIRRILSHPQAIAQCNKFLAGLERCHVESYFDTAMAARKVRDDADLSQAAIAGAFAAEIYGLKIIERDIANQKGNYTRFVVVSGKPISCDPQLDCKTSLIFATVDEKGALLKCLNIVGDSGINMTKLESRPRLGHPWQSLFYLDLSGNRNDPQLSDALDKLKRKTQFMKVLGSYPVRKGNW
ncbi:prephenate dehydratase [Rhodohalobacter halophilus]|uniref:prephenate dehydratase n=1 Tax=Rhodohalobacter halophilus TaxID=1812810 RepID=UPI00083FB963|nr:prephenate dehydratase [Rhodohalobacter halophilus]